MLHQACRNVALYNNNHPDFPMPIDQLEKYMQVILCFVLSLSLKDIYLLYCYIDLKNVHCRIKCILIKLTIVWHYLFTEISDLCCAVVLLW